MKPATVLNVSLRCAQRQFVSPSKNLQPAYLGARPLQREAPTGTIEIPKTGESWIVKVETDRESANQDVSRAKPLKATPRRALVVEKTNRHCAPSFRKSWNPLT